MRWKQTRVTNSNGCVVLSVQDKARYRRILHGNGFESIRMHSVYMKQKRVVVSRYSLPHHTPMRVRCAKDQGYDHHHMSYQQIMIGIRI